MTYDEYAKIRDSKGFTDYKVAKMTNIGRSTFSDWKNGRSTPKPDKIKKIADCLEIAFGKFYDNEAEYEKAFYEIYEEDIESIRSSKEAEAIARAYMEAPDSIKDAVCKLLDVERR